MKKILIVILSAVVMMFSMCACGSSDEDKVDIDFEIEVAVQSKATVECMVKYADVKNVTVSITNKEEIDDGEYEVKGYVTVLDEYGDKYKAKFDALVVVDDDGDAECKEFEMETPRKE